MNIFCCWVIGKNICQIFRYIEDKSISIRFIIDKILGWSPNDLYITSVSPILI